MMKRNPQQLALNNDDILRQILANFAINSAAKAPTDKMHENIKSSRNILYSAALVSRGFAPPALDLLWQAMSSIKPLVNLLPVAYPGLFQVGGYSVSTNMIFAYQPTSFVSGGI
ncbi:hypothetical protein BDN72DRAFT_847351 [Pluteus cervinus]|uniref:Uncharacterized protein n=1 Tax=Pluteus cervinus TaxID=181527 RepID=A0ACD3ACR8_9AGAR|nr:hypothetical protein BDN72DRAFT_847351 [Pluteus cervinus]